jgi:3-methyl-2-oxobutanoate hydroxymethyltransferase
MSPHSQPSGRAHPQSGNAAPMTVPMFQSMKEQRIPIVALTAYDYPTAAIVDAAGVDMVLVGDTLASVVLGYETTLPVSFDEMMVCFRAVRRGVRRALLVADLPFGFSHQDANESALDAAVKYMKAGAQAVKLEGGRSRSPLVRQMVDAGIPVVGHIGLRPQSVNTMGGYRVQGKTSEGAEDLLDEARALERAGIFALVLEGIPEEVSATISRSLSIPTIGIGAGNECDGQILVISDMLGLTVPPPPRGPNELAGRKPRFVREYLNLREQMLGAVRSYAGEVRSGQFPDASETYRLSEAESARMT